MANAATESTTDIGLDAFDIHTHIPIKTHMMGHKFYKRHNPPGMMWPPCMRTDIDALIDGGVRAALSSVYVLEHTMREDVWAMRWLSKVVPRIRRILYDPQDEVTHEALDGVEAQVEETRKRRGDVVEIAKSYSEMQRIMGEGKVALIHSLEGAHHLGGKLDNLEVFFERGVCHMIVPHFYTNEASTSVDPIPLDLWVRKFGCFGYERDPNGGITDWGHELVDRMLDIGMIVDTCHATPRGRGEILEIAENHAKKRPIIMSHVGVHELAPYPMNPEPDEIRRVADTGGVIGIIFMTFWLSKPEKHHCLDVVLDTIDHLVQHGGDEVVAFGSDFDGFTGVPKDLKSPRDFKRVREALVDRYGEERARKFLSGNADRVLREGWGKQ